MRTLIWGSTFKKAYKRVLKKHPNLAKDIKKTLELLVEDPFDSRLESHKLKGKLSGTWTCRASYDLRIIFDFVKQKDERDDAIFLIEIGTHEEVY